jgi:ABC-type dipeptide/oligopeptide/nickel transport system ATPase subunit
VQPAELRDKVMEVMKICGLAPQHYNRFPHEFSGGQRQRIGIARALILNPDFIIADEPISALDVSIQAQIINLFSDLRDERGVTFLFISHDLGVVEHLCDDVAVMYLGNWWKPPAAMRCSAARCTPTPRRCWRRCRRSIAREPVAVVQGDPRSVTPALRLPFLFTLPAGNGTLPH